MAIAYPEYEKLFLLEVLVDSVYIPVSNLDVDQATKSSLKETCVMFQFLNYPPLTVCEEDFFKSPRKSIDAQLNFKSGKSCIFSIRSSSVPTLPYNFDVNVCVLRKVDGPPYKIVLGRTAVNLGDSFAALIHSSVAEPDLPLQKTQTGTFEITDENGRPVGQMTAFLRISCFGQLIVTQFQVGGDHDHDASMFKGTEPKRVVEIPGDPTKIPRFEVDPSYRPRVAEAEAEPPSSAATETAGNRGYGDAREGPGRYPADAGMTYNDRPDAVARPTGPPEPEGDFKEIVAEIRGHSLHIRVPMKSKKDRDELVCKKKLVEDIEGPVCKFAPPLNLCDCDFPVPPEAIPRCGRF